MKSKSARGNQKNDEKIKKLLSSNPEEFLENVSEELKTLINTNHELTDEIAIRLITNLGVSRNNKGFDVNEVEKILKWGGYHIYRTGVIKIRPQF